MTAYPLRLRPPQRITIHAGRQALDGARTACGSDLPLIGPDAAYSEPDLGVTCHACRDAIGAAVCPHGVELDMCDTYECAQTFNARVHAAMPRLNMRAVMVHDLVPHPTEERHNV